MGRIKQKGKAGAAKAYVTRSAAVKKLQCSLADFRRLCILKGEPLYFPCPKSGAVTAFSGIFPREPKNRKKANKGSSAPTSFYYAKDIAYLAHEPVLKKLREHKAFAKKLSRALGRGEWSSAKSLEENKPVYRLDHIIKERPVDLTFISIAFSTYLGFSPQIPHLHGRTQRYRRCPVYNLSVCLFAFQSTPPP
jgi:pescadillo protein